MIDRNDVYLQGRIGNDFKYSKTQNSAEYATFSLEIDPPQNKIDRGSRTVTYIRIMVFDKKHVQYLQDVNAGKNSRCSIIGYLNSFKTTYRGVEMVTNTVVVRDINILKTKTNG